MGRAALDEVVAEVMGAESAAVRVQFVSGTHAIASALFGCLRPGDELLAVAGRCGGEEGVCSDGCFHDCVLPCCASTHRLTLLGTRHASYLSG